MKVKYNQKPYIKYILFAVLGFAALFTLVELIKSGKGLNTAQDWVDVKSHTDKAENYTYDFRMNLDVDEMKMDGELEFTYVNNNDEDMSTLVFYLYANSFKEEGYEAIDPEEYYLAYPNGFTPGSIDIKSIQIENGGSYEVKGNQEHLLEITLNEPVKSGKTLDIVMEYTVQIPNCIGRFGYGESTISLVNCNPIMAVYDEGYYSYEYNNMGDPFYSECADYSAVITVDEDYLVAVTGDIYKEETADGKRSIAVLAENMRDFGFVASNDFDVASTQINGITVNSFGFTNHRMTEKALEAGVNAIDTFSKLYGEYPYNTFNVVESNFYVGGMEYPGMVLIDSSYYNNLNKSIMEMIIAHETAHQWWYAQVGSDQVAEPWLDEALTEFSTRMYYETVYPNSYEVRIDEAVDNSYDYMNANIAHAEVDINSHTMMFDSSWQYSLVVYGKGMEMFDNLRQEIGDDAFFAGLQDYLEDNRYEIVDEYNLYDALQGHTDIDIEKWFENNFTVEIG